MPRFGCILVFSYFTILHIFKKNTLNWCLSQQIKRMNYLQVMINQLIKNCDCLTALILICVVVWFGGADSLTDVFMFSLGSSVEAFGKAPLKVCRPKSNKWNILGCLSGEKLHWTLTKAVLPLRTLHQPQTSVQAETETLPLQEEENPLSPPTAFLLACSSSWWGGGLLPIMPSEFDLSALPESVDVCPLGIIYSLLLEKMLLQRWLETFGRMKLCVWPDGAQSFSSNLRTVFDFFLLNNRSVTVMTGTSSCSAWTVWFWC